MNPEKCDHPKGFLLFGLELKCPECGHVDGRLTSAREQAITQGALEIGAQRLAELLLRHGSHTGDCMVYINGSCYCGWEELKPKLKKGLARK